MIRSARLSTVLVLLACGGDWMTGPGTPLELSHDSLEGRWVHVLSVTSPVGNPSGGIRTEFSPDQGQIMEFDSAGGVQHSRYRWDVVYTSPTYTIIGDTLTMEFSYLAEVSTTQLVLTLNGVTRGFDGDGNQEPAIHAVTYQRGKD